MEYKNQTENRAFQEMLQAAVKRLQNTFVISLQLWKSKTVIPEV